jgi:hypothetical protein
MRRRDSENARTVDVPFGGTKRGRVWFGPAPNDTVITATTSVSSVTATTEGALAGPRINAVELLLPFEPMWYFGLLGGSYSPTDRGVLEVSIRTGPGDAVPRPWSLYPRRKASNELMRPEAEFLLSAIESAAEEASFPRGLIVVDRVLRTGSAAPMLWRALALGFARTLLARDRSDAATRTIIQGAVADAITRALAS